MPRTISIRELENQTSHIVRAVRENGVEYVITSNGEPVAVLRAFAKEDVQRLWQAELDKALAEMRSLAEEVAAAWTSPRSGMELIDEQAQVNHTTRRP